ncbi:MAG: hypothetical protein OXB84_02210, partial [Halobacteriovoraceae bacterium]|nr:hypothetical protein [Halobacteriovoraceae bacterium]
MNLSWLLGIFNNDKVSLSIFIIFFLFMLYFFRKDIKSSDSGYSQIIFTLGILGTFTGISWGLLNFNSMQIQSSIPTLLSGLKTSFFTSIVGMFLVIIIELKNKTKKREFTPQSKDEYLFEIYKLLKNKTSTPEELKVLLRPGMEELIKTIQLGNNESKKGLENI